MNTYDDSPRWTERLAFIVLVAVICGGLFVFLRGDGSGAAGGLGARTAAASAVEPEPTIAPAVQDPPIPVTPSTTEIQVVDEPAIDEPAIDETPQVSASDEPATSPGGAAAAVADETNPSDVGDDEPGDLAGTTTTTTATSTTTSADAAAVATEELGYPAAADGTPLPIVATYDIGTVTLTGHVPSDAARERLIALARANSQDDAEVIDRLIVNERVPVNVGVRVIEKQSPRFPEGDAVITAEHAQQLDRVGGIMQALPNVNALVIGHADQRGDEAVNFELSNDRARAVLDYLVYLGVAPTRLSVQAAGETDLLTLDDDSAALALNRRTEFVFYGILVG